MVHAVLGGDSTGLGILIAARKRTVAYDSWLRLTVPCAHTVRKIFAVTGMTRLFVFIPSVTDAVADVGVPGLQGLEHPHQG